MRTRLKMCGMFRREDLMTVNEICPDYCGFIVNFPKSHRSVDEDGLRSLTKLLDRKRIPAVGVFVDQDPEFILRLLREGVIDIAQLHGNESDEEVLKIREQSQKPVIKAFQLGKSVLTKAPAGSASEGEIPVIPAFEKEHNGELSAAIELLCRAKECPADFLLFDTGQGSGRAMDFHLFRCALDRVDFSRPFFLAGGLSAENMENAVELLQPYGVDLSSALETERRKDPGKMRQVAEVCSRIHR